MAIYSIKRGFQFGRISRLPLFFPSKTSKLIALFRMKIEGAAPSWSLTAPGKHFVNDHTPPPRFL
jgi:hypothetical protein